MDVVILEHTPNPERVVYLAARQCYAEGFVGDFNHSEELYAPLIRKVINNGHTSVLEHVSFTFAIEGISRACSHQLVRFRVASFSQQSQRYVEFKNGFEHIVPPSIQNHINPVVLETYSDFMINCQELYEYFISHGINKEDARFILPNATETKIVVTMNARELYHACELRCCNHAQWEIRNLFNAIKELVKPIAPTVFAKLGAACETKGYCPESERSCGKVERKNEK